MKISLNLSPGDELNVQLDSHSLNIVTPDGVETQIRVPDSTGSLEVNPAVYLGRPNALGVVMNRGEGPGDGVLQDENNRIKNIGVPG